MATQITLILEGNSYQVLRCRYGFTRETDYRGRPTTGLLGGDIHLIIETTDDDFLWERLSGRKPRPVSGRLEITDTEGMSPIRTLQWYDAYIYAIDEGMVSISSLPMTQSLQITTRRLDINSHIRLDRRFPQTYGFWWEEYKEPEQVVVAAETVEEEEESTPSITAAAWQDEEKTLLTLIPHDLEQTVTLHIETTGFDNPVNDEEEVLIQIKDEEEKLLFDYTTRPNEEGEINLKLSVEDIISEKHDNPTEYLKLHPDLKLNLFASWLQTPDERQEAVLEKEAQCTIQFRRPKNYNGDFLFDWYREGDDNDPLNDWYKNLLTNELFFKNYVTHNYKLFKENWKTKHPKYKENYSYAVPSMTIIPGFTANLRLKLTVEKPVRDVEFKISGGDSDTFSLNYNTLKIEKTGIYYHEEELQITCNKVFSQDMFLEAYVGNQKVGQLEFIANHEPFKLDIAIIPVRLMDIKGKILDPPKFSSTDKKRMKELFQQLYIFPEIHTLETLDCTRDLYPYRINGESKKLPLLTGTFMHITDNGGIITNDDNIKIPKNPSIPEKFHYCRTYKYITKFAEEEYKENEIYKNSWKVFVFPLHNYNERTIGVATIKKDGDNVTTSDEVYLYEVTKEYNPYVMVHEVLHTLGLEHPKDNKMFKEKYHWVFKDFYMTDNIMDYAKSDSTKTHLEASKKLRSMWKWQYEMARDFAKEYYPKRIIEHTYEK